VFPMEYELNVDILLRRNLLFKRLGEHHFLRVALKFMSAYIRHYIVWLLTAS
jgi:hypothetical protein